MEHMWSACGSARLGSLLVECMQACAYAACHGQHGTTSAGVTTPCQLLVVLVARRSVLNTLQLRGLPGGS